MGVTFFDLDGTLTRSDTYRAFLISCLLRRPSRWLATPLLAGAVALHLAKLRSNTWLKGVFLNLILGGCGRATIARWAEAFCADTLPGMLRAEAADKIAARRAAGDTIVIATASPDLYMTELAGKLGVDDFISTRAEWDSNDRLTGRLAGGNCYGAEKLSRVQAWMNERGASGPVTAYSDHHADIPLLSFAGAGVAVWPTTKLRAEAETRNLAVEMWA